MTLSGTATPHGEDARLAAYRAGWDPEAGLWKQPGPGHTPDTLDLAALHAARESAWLLVAAGMDGVLDRVEPGRVLRALRDLQVADGPRRGCFRWYREDRAVVDTNAGFFTSLALIVLYNAFGDRLAAEDRTLLALLLDEAGVWFDSELEHLGPGSLRYPNKCLGDLVCGWLLAEINGRDTADLSGQMKLGADYYRDTHWGWGEHLSDVYSTVMKFELTALLLFARRLDPAIRADYERLFRDLLTLDALFAGGPRVPAIRSYCLQASPSAEPATLRPFLDSLEPWPVNGSRRLFAPLKSLAYAKGFQQTYAVPPAAAQTFTVPCFGGTEAFARVTDAFRMGALSRYPLMDDAEHPSWGLCWQSMPVCYWNRNGDWAFLQWEAAGNGVARSHPARSRHHRGAVQLSGPAEPPVVGETVSTRAGSAFLVLRRMPRFAPGWPEVIDRLRLLNGTADSVVESREGGWHALTLAYPTADGRPRLLFRALFRPLGSDVRMILTREEGRLDWEAHYPADPSRAGSAAGLWIWEAGETLSPPPACAMEDRAWRVTCEAPSAPASFVISPDDAAPRWR